jgi:hypothetical protein
MMCESELVHCGLCCEPIHSDQSVYRFGYYICDFCEFCRTADDDEYEDQ